jgi:hypothetical protein
MPFHLNEGRLVVCVTTVVDEFLDSWNSLLSVFEFSSYPQSGASDKLIVLDVHNPPRDITVEDVQGKIECFGAQAEGEVELYEKFDEAGAHVPLDFWLLVHR